MLKAEVWKFLGTVLALQASYLVWGIMQESIMNTTFTPTPLTPSGKFPSATFCVFSNRVVAVLVAYIACKRVHGSVQSQAPLMSFTPCSVSNTVSSWAQYQALNYIPFSLQTLFKATKVIPVMVMGSLLRGNKYKLVEYLEAAAITIGVGVFSAYKVSPSASASASADGAGDEADEEWLGYLCLCSYILCDAFTSQYQSKLYAQYGKIDHWHMMFGINASSVCITTMAMILSGEIPVVVEFLTYNPETIYYNIATSVTSATGQIAIYYCIRTYGPTVFTIVMTTRQVFSIVLSNILFDHPTPPGSVAGAVLVFTAVFYSSYRRLGESRNPEAAPVGKTKDSSEGLALNMTDSSSSPSRGVGRAGVGVGVDSWDPMSAKGLLSEEK